MVWTGRAGKCRHRCSLEINLVVNLERTTLADLHSHSLGGASAPHVNMPTSRNGQWMRAPSGNFSSFREAFRNLSFTIFSTFRGQIRGQAERRGALIVEEEVSANCRLFVSVTPNIKPRHTVSGCVSRGRSGEQGSELSEKIRLPNSPTALCLRKSSCVFSPGC